MNRLSRHLLWLMGRASLEKLPPDAGGDTRNVYGASFRSCSSLSAALCPLRAAGVRHLREGHRELLATRSSHLVVSGSPVVILVAAARREGGPTSGGRRVVPRDPVRQFQLCWTSGVVLRVIPLRVYMLGGKRSGLRPARCPWGFDVYRPSAPSVVRISTQPVARARRLSWPRQRFRKRMD